MTQLPPQKRLVMTSKFPGPSITPLATRGGGGEDKKMEWLTIM